MNRIHAYFLQLRKYNFNGLVEFKTAQFEDEYQALTLALRKNTDEIVWNLR